MAPKNWSKYVSGFAVNVHVPLGAVDSVSIGFHTPLTW